jgi:ATP-dependent Clp protease adapter protein ClpS
VTFRERVREMWLGLGLAFQQTATQSQVLELDCFTAEAKALLRATFRRAAFFGATFASTRHLVVEAFEREPALSACVRALDLDVDVVRDAVAAPLGDEQASTEMDAVAAVKADRMLWFVAVFARENARREAGGKPASPKDLVANALAVDEALAAELDAFGVSRAALLTWFEHGVLAHAPIDDDAFGGTELLDVWLDNDDRTPMDFVVATLRHDLALDATTAFTCMRTVHEKGRARVGTFPRPEAIARANAVLERARLAGLPLRARVQPSAG